jgi:hypothetical protein
MMSELHARIAAALRTAQETGVPIDPIREAIGAGDVAEARIAGLGSVRVEFGRREARS